MKQNFVDSQGSHISRQTHDVKTLGFRASSGNFSVRIRSGAYTKQVKDGNIESKLNGHAIFSTVGNKELYDI